MSEPQVRLSSSRSPSSSSKVNPFKENPERRRQFEDRSVSPPSTRVAAASLPAKPTSAAPGDFARNHGAPLNIRDNFRDRYRERQRQARERELEEQDKPAKKPVDPAEEYKRLKELRSGGRYIPRAKLRALEAQLNIVKDPKEQQRAHWDTLRKSINRLINQVNNDNIKVIVQDIFAHNLIRGRGVFCKYIIKAQAQAQPFTPVYAALAAIINSKLPQVGELLVTRLIIQFRRAFKSNNKAQCLSSAIFLAHLCNQQVAHEIIALEILFLLLGQPTDDSVEIAVAFMKEVGAFLAEACKAGNNGVFERFRAILHEGNLEKRTQYMIEVLFQVRKDNFKNNEIIPVDLDLVEEDDQVTHMIGLDDQLKGEEILNVFKFDPDYEANEEKYNEMKREILGDDEEESGSDNDSVDSVSEDEEEPAPTSTTQTSGAEPVVIKDMTNVELVTLRKTIYLTIMSSMSVDEAAHKLFRVVVPEGKEIEIVNMIIECCSQEKIYNKLYGGVAVRFCLKAKFWRDLFAQSFQHYYSVIHRYETNPIRNIATLFGYLLASDGLGWEVFENVHINEEETTTSSRIFIDMLFKEMIQEMGIKEMQVRFKEEYLQPFLVNMFPKDEPVNTRFSVNLFTAIGLGVLTEDMREYLNNLPPPSPVRSDDALDEAELGTPLNNSGEKRTDNKRKYVGSPVKRETNTQLKIVWSERKFSRSPPVKKQSSRASGGATPVAASSSNDVNRTSRWDEKEQPSSVAPDVEAEKKQEKKETEADGKPAPSRGDRRAKASDYL
ncbi:hypothetical protein D0Z00_002348 [Geotrichum galactomycetum]|uniref:Uncharacterized protein n=1 Tax=Geotrichum galactomycetum TaxID=27317 RepID=A0ACB6V4C6_9ASCO|nr:hypothetical protein D0Z00_002348 [Geotrichum candidum]